MTMTTTMEHNDEFIFGNKVDDLEHMTEYDPLVQVTMTMPINNEKELILDLFKKDYLMTIEEKINLTSFLMRHLMTHGHFSEFFEEECHLSMINWIHRKKDQNLFDTKLNDLIYNILTIFEILPINVEDLFTLNIFDKLNKIRKSLKFSNLLIFQKIDELLNYWTKFCTGNFLATKTKRDKEECFEIKKVSNNSSLYLYFL